MDSVIPINFAFRHIDQNNFIARSSDTSSQCLHDPQFQTPHQAPAPLQSLPTTSKRHLMSQFTTTVKQLPMPKSPL